MMTGFMFTCAIILGFAVNVSLFPYIAPEAFLGVTFGKADYSYMSMLLMVFPAFSIISYLILFNIGLYFDQHWEYDDDISIKENFRKNKKYAIAKSIFWIIMFFVTLMVIRISK